jgi:predicted regulator of Ras-like GTPase activity (Roadblock/LC7/MglB family)
MTERPQDPDRTGGLSRLVHHLAWRSGLSEGDVPGSGPGGTLTDEDVLRAVTRRAFVVDARVGTGSSSSAAIPAPPRPVTTIAQESAPSGPAPTRREARVSKQEDLSRIITEMRRSIPELHGVMIASVDGLSIAHDFPEAEAERVAAMAATALGLGKRITERTNLGGLNEAVVRGDYGYLVVYAAGESAVLVMSGPTNSNLGLMRIEARAASAEISHVLR